MYVFTCTWKSGITEPMSSDLPQAIYKVVGDRLCSKGAEIENFLPTSGKTFATIERMLADIPPEGLKAPVKD